MHILLQFAGLLLIVFGMELAGGITGYVLREDVSDILENTVNNSMSKYLYNEEIKKTWDIMQHDVSTACTCSDLAFSLEISRNLFNQWLKTYE